MKNTFIFILILSGLIFAQEEFNIKSLRIYQKGNEISFPVSIYESQLTIEFDIQAERTPNWIIFFKFCDKNWQPYENIFLANEMYNTEYNLWFDVLSVTNDRARYHYKDSFPSEDITFPFSGKWKYFITDSQDTSIVFGSGKFYVINNPEVGLSIDLKAERLEGKTVDPATFGEVYYMGVSFKLPDTLFDQRVIDVEIIENRKLDYPIVIEKTYDDPYRYYEIDNVNELSFYVRDITPGNNYRQSNIMDKGKFIPPQTYSRFDGIDVSRKFRPSGRDFNGGYKLLNFKNDYSVYMDVTFRLRPPEGYYENIFLVGSFNDWNVLPEFQMMDDDGLFTNTVELKRGIYDYQYVTADINDGEIDNISWLELEGNDWRTSNEYFIFLYYYTEELGGYDKIIGFQKLSSKGL
ncbi:MAG: DUF5103 domain-containing protein [Melioribacteraceae bacterium]|nr:DUF5103 domain-containing protein [Melioribacteraceae bacterium]